VKSTDVSEEHVSVFRAEEDIRETRLKQTALKLVPSLTYSSTLKMEAVYSSGTLVDFQRTSRPHVAEDKLFKITAGYRI
jgi:hypothetical protein